MKPEQESAEFTWLVKEVGAFKPTAAKLLMEDHFDNFSTSGCIWGAFLFSDSPQGVNYWLDIAERVDPDTEMC